MTLMEWLQALTAGGAFGAAALAMAAYLKTRPAMKTAQIQGEAALWAEVHTLRAELKREREACDERIDRIEKRHVTEMTELKGDVQTLRHDRNNTKQALNYVLMSMRRLDNPDLSNIAELAEDMIKKGDDTLAQERGAMKSPLAGYKGEEL